MNSPELTLCKRIMCIFWYSNPYNLGHKQDSAQTKFPSKFWLYIFFLQSKNSNFFQWLIRSSEKCVCGQLLCFFKWVCVSHAIIRSPMRKGLKVIKWLLWWLQSHHKTWHYEHSIT